MVFCLHVCLSTMCMPNALRGQRRVPSPLGLEIPTVVAAMWVLGMKPQSLGEHSVAVKY